MSFDTALDIRLHFHQPHAATLYHLIFGQSAAPAAALSAILNAVAYAWSKAIQRQKGFQPPS